MQRCLLFATELYALPILRPLAVAAAARGLELAWVVPDHVAAHLRADEARLRSQRALRQFAPDAVFCAANWVPAAFPGCKVQLFHGFNARKRSPDRGHFRLRGFFDLYCTQGPATTAPFRELAAQHPYFSVIETGWPKLDPLFGAEPPGVTQLRTAVNGRPCVLYAATFTPALSAAPAMRETLAQLIARGDRYWLLTLHPKCDPDLIAAYRELAAAHPENAVFLESEQMLDMLRAADALVCDTSSVIDEFAVQRKPVVTVNNRAPQPFMLDVASPDAVDAALTHALTQPEDVLARITEHAAHIHPQRDGRSSERVLDAAKAVIDGSAGARGRKPWNLWRRWQTRRKQRLLFPD